uniref:Uncharacterized protein n=1 Tax=Cacopsylla melanoneura TaxID=428564 RepID=A0A8D8S5K6_9HEMI
MAICFLWLSQNNIDKKYFQKITQAQLTRIDPLLTIKLNHYEVLKYRSFLQFFLNSSLLKARSGDCCKCSERRQVASHVSQDNVHSVCQSIFLEVFVSGIGSSRFS